MPQTNYLPLFQADYPLLAPRQKPGGVTVSTTLSAHAVPNKPQWSGTFTLMFPVDAPVSQEELDRDALRAAAKEGAKAAVKEAVKEAAPAHPAGHPAHTASKSNKK